MKLPGIDLGGLNIAAEVREFKALLQGLSDKLDTLIEIERAANGLPTCAECEVKGRLHCRLHGPEGGVPGWPDAHRTAAPIDQREGWQR